MERKACIIIPARYGSSRLPAKPLVKIAGKTLLSRTSQTAKKAAALSHHGADLCIATDHEDIFSHAQELRIHAVMTDPKCPTGTDRVWQACEKLDWKYQVVLNLQGDAPFAPASLLATMLDTLIENPSFDILTPVYSLKWDELEQFRESKINSPFSGTCVITGKDHRALWFSKQLIPAIRKEELQRAKESVSPVKRHIGIYGYQAHALKAIHQLEQGYYEQIEELEQLRWLEANMRIQTIPTELTNMIYSLGIDSQNDVEIAQKWIIQHGDPHEP